MACVLCNSDKKNDIAYGEFLRKKDVSVHEFCLYLSSGLVQKGEDNDGLFGFLPKHILEESKRVKQLYCTYCRKKSANIGCCERKCHRTFHLICGLENGAENHFRGTFNSYCDRHGRKKWKVPPKEFCCICYDRLIDGKELNHSRKVILAPCCKNGWFHRTCLQGFARSAGYFFKCPLCNNTEKFRTQIPYYGIFIRDADAAWELEPNAFSELLQRPSKCEAEICHHRNGRKAIDSERNPLVCCHTCGAVAVHKKCNTNGKRTFICAECQKVIDSRNSAGDGDSGHDSIEADDENDHKEEEIIDICNITDSDDDDDDNDIIVSRRCLKHIARQVIEDDSEEENSNSKRSVMNFGNYTKTEEDIYIEETKPSNSSNELVHRFSYDSSNDDFLNEEMTSLYKTDSSIELINRERQLFTSDSNETSDYESSANNNKSVSIEIYIDDEDPLEYLHKMYVKEKIQKLSATNVTSHTHIPTQETKTVDKTTFDTKPHTSKLLKNPNLIDGNHKEQSENLLPNNNEIPNAAFKGNSNDSTDVDANFCANSLDISCIAKRTRHRKSIISNQANDNIFSSISSTSSNSSTDINGERESKILNVSCVANRTRRRKSQYYHENNLGISEENFSENSESYQTPSKKSKFAHERLNYVNDEGFHSAPPAKNDKSPYSSQYSVSVNGVRCTRNQRLRLISLTTDDEVDENDAMKLR